MAEGLEGIEEQLEVRFFNRTKNQWIHQLYICTVGEQYQLALELFLNHQLCRSSALCVEPIH